MVCVHIYYCVFIKIRCNKLKNYRLYSKFWMGSPDFIIRFLFIFIITFIREYKLGCSI